jgi:hypothetical protein
LSVAPHKAEGKKKPKGLRHFMDKLQNPNKKKNSTKVKKVESAHFPSYSEKIEKSYLKIQWAKLACRIGKALKSVFFRLFQMKNM